MVEAHEIKITVGRGELAIRLEKSRVACYGRVQQIDCLEKIRAHAGAKPLHEKEVPGASVQIEGGEIGCYWLRYGQCLCGRDFRMKLLRNFFRDFTLDCEPVI